MPELTAYRQLWSLSRSPWLLVLCTRVAEKRAVLAVIIFRNPCNRRALASQPTRTQSSICVRVCHWLLCDDNSRALEVEPGLGLAQHVMLQGRDVCIWPIHLNLTRMTGTRRRNIVTYVEAKTSISVCDALIMLVWLCLSLYTCNRITHLSKVP
ncbi:hypothetical protein CONLIGDRAFT_635493 [Coniochaeta ligniaria NRRL 30616]|uniref:Uncharacterized protein n=1 Tax=Coniochaeta ligniaria NRRL 30616 TaxID=1408157 RepID=A0A1J7IX76_9PEZI|nr:hypothetical protein CONLIGDRAFT_635493 [Coniochaeta ligniaria NRRL 30616]